MSNYTKICKSNLWLKCVVCCVQQILVSGEEGLFNKGGKSLLKLRAVPLMLLLVKFRVNLKLRKSGPVMKVVSA